MSDDETAPSRGFRSSSSESSSSNDHGSLDVVVGVGVDEEDREIQQYPYVHKEEQELNHPYLELTYPHLSRLLTEIVKYEKYFVTMQCIPERDCTWEVQDEDDGDEDEDDDDDEKSVLLSCKEHHLYHKERGRCETLRFNALDRTPKALPADIAIFSELEDLELKNCISLPGSFKYLTNLRVLNISDVTTTVHVPVGCLSGLTNLTCLTLDHSNVAILEQFLELPNLKYLTIVNRHYPSVQDLITTLQESQCSFTDSLKSFCLSYRCAACPSVVSGQDMRDVAELLVAFVSKFPNIGRIGLWGGRLTRDPPLFVGLLADRLMQLKKDRPGLFPLKITEVCLHYYSGKALLFGCFDGLKNTMKLLDVLENLIDFGSGHVVYGFSKESDLMYGPFLPPPPEYDTLKLKCISEINKRRANFRLAMKLPLELWHHCIRHTGNYKTFMPRNVGVNRWHPWLPTESETKEWQATQVYTLLRFGLMKNEDWRHGLRVHNKYYV